MWQFRIGFLYFLPTDNNCKNNFDSRIIWLDSLSLSERQTVQESVCLLLSYFGSSRALTLSSFSPQRSFPGRPGLPSGSTQIKRQSPWKQNPNSFSMSAMLSAVFQVYWKPGNSINRMFAQGDTQNILFFSWPKTRPDFLSSESLRKEISHVQHH